MAAIRARRASLFAHLKFDMAILFPLTNEGFDAPLARRLAER